MLNDYEERIQRGVKVTVIGGGFVGLSLAVVFSSRGVEVCVVDENPEVIDRLNRGNMDFFEPGIEEDLKRDIGKTLFFTTDAKSAVEDCDICFITVGTPLNVFHEPDITYVISACETIFKWIVPGSIVALCSTVPVGTTNQVLRQIVEKRSDLKVEENVGLAFCPERMLEGTAMSSLRSFPKIIGATGEKTGNALVSFFNSVDISPIPVSTPEVAEMAKLLCNAYRAVNIALGNEFAMMCEGFNVNAHEVIEAANTSPIVNIMRPGMMGGSCLTKDPYFLTCTSMDQGFYPKILLAAKELNEGLPVHIVKLILSAYDEAGKTIKGSKIAVLGASFKGETSDVRETPVKPMIDLIKQLDIGEITVYDPYVDRSHIQDWGVEFSQTVEKAVTDADCVIIGTEHKEIGSLDFKKVLKHAADPPILIDSKGVLMHKKDLIQRGIGLI